jgi:hypothetical protein
MVLAVGSVSAALVLEALAQRGQRRPGCERKIRLQVSVELGSVAMELADFAKNTLAGVGGTGVGRFRTVVRNQSTRI